ncbi:MAG: MerR family transcriptional regulator [Chloroflexi bacterium]|nr:MerR family transcriptional regulator [Chloroflexota bacterium]
MAKKKAVFHKEQSDEYEHEAAASYGSLAEQSARLWSSYSDEEKQAVIDEGNAIFEAFAANIDQAPDSPEIQVLLTRWHAHLRHFYEPTIELLGGLGDLYHDDPRFRKTFSDLHPDLPIFLKEAIAVYVDMLETRWLEQELGLLDLEE